MSVVNLTADVSMIRLDKFLADEIEILSRSKLKACIKAHGVLVDGQPEKPSHLLRGGEVIQVEIPEETPTTIDGEPIPLDILHEDHQIVVIDKPAGLVIHPGAGNPDGTLVNGLVYHFNELSHVYGNQRPGIVHRLDKNTSGVLVVAKSDESHMRLAQQFNSRTVEKTYLALVWGSPGEKEGVIDSPISRHAGHRQKFAVDESGRSAVTQYRVMEEFDQLSSIQLKPRTGRTHQLRVHMSSIGHPIFGDETYGGGRSRMKGYSPDKRAYFLRLLSLISRQALHAWSISFDHPTAGNRVTFSAPLPKDFGNVLESMRSHHD